MDLPKVVVISVYFNREQYVNESVKSLLGQSYGNLEIILVDDNSNDSTYDSIMAVVNGDSRVSVIRNSTNKGFTKTLISTLANIKADFIAIHGSGDVSAKERLQQQADFLHKNQTVVALGASVVIETTGKDKIEITRNDSVDYSKYILLDNPFTHGEVMFRLDAYRLVGGYRALFTYAQDRDLWIRMSKVGQLRVLKEPLYTKKNLAGGVSENPIKLLKQRIYSNHARALFYQKDTDEESWKPDKAHVFSLGLSLYSIYEIIRIMHPHREEVRSQLLSFLGRYRNRYFINRYCGFLQNNEKVFESLAIAPIIFYSRAIQYLLLILKKLDSSLLSGALEFTYGSIVTMEDV